MSDKLEALKDLASEMVIKFNHWSKCAALTSESTSALHSQTLSKTAQLITELTEALERGAKNEHALGGLLDEMTRRRDSQANRANAAEQREEHLKASVDVLSAKNAELEQRLQQPIKLPKREIGMACEFVSDHIVVSLAAVLVEAATAGFKTEVEGE